MELERTHTQPRDPNTQENVIDNYDNNGRDNNNNLKRYAKNFILESASVQLGSLELRGNVLLLIPKKERRAITVILFCFLLFIIG